MDPESKQDVQVSEGGAQVLEELRGAWIAKHHVTISCNGTGIDFHGRKIWLNPKHLPLYQFRDVAEDLVLSLVHHKVTSTTVTRCEKLTDTAMAKVCPELRAFNLEACQNLTNESIMTIAKGCPEIKELKRAGIKDFTNESIKASAQGCPVFNKLDVFYIANLPDESVRRSAEAVMSSSISMLLV